MQSKYKNISYISFVLATVGGLVCCHEDEVNSNEAPKESKVQELAEGRMSASEFQQHFVDIISTTTMQSALTEKVHDLCDNLTPELVSEVLEIAARPAPVGSDEEAWLLGFNQIMLESNMRFGYASSDGLYNLATNPRAPEVMRDYACQHYFRAASKHLDEIGKNSNPEKSNFELQKVLDAGTAIVSRNSENVGTVNGVAFLGIAALAARYQDNSNEMSMIRGSIATMTLPILSNWQKYELPTRIAAMQAASRLKVEDAGPIIHDIALDTSASTRDRLSAIGSLKYYPEYLDESFKTQISKSDKKLFTAFQEITKSLNSQTSN